MSPSSRVERVEEQRWWLLPIDPEKGIVTRIDSISKRRKSFNRLHWLLGCVCIFPCRYSRFSCRSISMARARTTFFSLSLSLCRAVTFTSFSSFHRFFQVDCFLLWWIIRESLKLALIWLAGKDVGSISQRSDTLRDFQFKGAVGCWRQIGNQCGMDIYSFLAPHRQYKLPTSVSLSIHLDSTLRAITLCYYLQSVRTERP